MHSIWPHFLSALTLLPAEVYLPEWGNWGANCCGKKFLDTLNYVSLYPRRLTAETNVAPAQWKGCKVDISWSWVVSLKKINRRVGCVYALIPFLHLHGRSVVKWKQIVSPIQICKSLFRIGTNMKLLRALLSVHWRKKACFEKRCGWPCRYVCYGISS